MIINQIDKLKRKVKDNVHILIWISIFLSICSAVSASTALQSQQNLINHNVDWTILGSFAMALVALVLTIYQIMQFFMGPKKIRDESLRASEFIKEIQKSINDLDDKYDDLLKHIGDIDIGVAERRTNISNMQDEIKEIRKEQKELSHGLDNLLRQLIEYLGNK